MNVYAIFLLQLLTFTQLALAQFYCADLLQNCAKTAAEYTEQILQYKEEAFKQCVKRPACHTEKKLFDECFDASVSATHMSNNEDNSGNTHDGDTRITLNETQISPKDEVLMKFFMEKSIKYRSALDRCFVRSPFVPKRSFFGPSIIDEDAAYARGIYQFDLADKLWGLPELTITRPSLDSNGICGIHPNPGMRLFGSGISRSSSSPDPKANNITSSCMLDEDEINCYREALDLNTQYVQLVYNRDYALRACIQSIRQQTVCRMNDKSRLRACLCGVREQYDNELQSSIVQCIKSKFPQPPALLIELSNNVDSDGRVQEQVESSPLVFDTPGAVINGQCMCSCNKEAAKKSFISQKMEEAAVTIQKDEKVPEESNMTPSISSKFKDNSPRLMMPSDAQGKVFWTNNISIS